MTTTTTYLTPAQDNLGLFMQRGIAGPMTMLNLVRFREHADYAHAPEAAPDQTISGRSAFREYIEAIRQPLAQVGGEVAMTGQAGNFLIGPLDEQWDGLVIIRFPGVAAFVSFTSSADYAKASVHRTAAVEDSRLLPLEEGEANTLFS